MPPADAAIQHSTSIQHLWHACECRAQLSIWALRMSRSGGVKVVFPITRKNRNIKALELYFLAVKSSRARNSKTEGVLDNSYGVACRRSLKLGADRAPGRRSGIRANSERHSRI